MLQFQVNSSPVISAHQGMQLIFHLNWNINNYWNSDHPINRCLYRVQMAGNWRNPHFVATDIRYNWGLPIVILSVKLKLDLTGLLPDYELRTAVWKLEDWESDDSISTAQPCVLAAGSIDIVGVILRTSINMLGRCLAVFYSLFTNQSSANGNKNSLKRYFIENDDFNVNKSISTTRTASEVRWVRRTKIQDVTKW